MRRFAAAVALGVVSSIAVAEAAQDSSSCPPDTSVQVINASATTYTMQISARNTCTCQIAFEACSSDRKPRCSKTIKIGPGQTGQVVVSTSVAGGKADYHWECSPRKTRRRSHAS